MAAANNSVAGVLGFSSPSESLADTLELSSENKLGVGVLIIIEKGEIIFNYTFTFYFIFFYFFVITYY